MKRYAVGLFAAVTVTAATLFQQPPTPETREPFGAVPRSPHWPSVRAAHLKLEPICAACGGRDELNVHHVKSFRKNPELELDPKNLVTLCRHHHFYIGHAQNWASSNPSVRSDIKQLKDVYDRIKNNREED